MTIITHLKINFTITFLSRLIYRNLLNFSFECECISSFEVVLEYFLLILSKIQCLKNHLPRDNKLTLKQSPSGLSIRVETLIERHKILGWLNNVLSISTKNVFSFFIGNFILFLCFTYRKAMCYVSLEFPALNLKQDSTMVAHKGAMFSILKEPVNLNQYWGTIGVLNASIILIKIKNRPISRLYYFCNTNQVYINIYFFLVLLLLSVLLYYFRQKNPKSHSSVLV